MDLKALDPTTLPRISAQLWLDGKGSWFRHGLLSASFVLFYLLLNRPEILLISKLGFTIWYPATRILEFLGFAPEETFEWGLFAAGISFPVIGFFVFGLSVPGRLGMRSAWGRLAVFS